MLHFWVKHFPETCVREKFMPNVWLIVPFLQVQDTLARTLQQTKDQLEAW